MPKFSKRLTTGVCKLQSNYWWEEFKEGEMDRLKEGLAAPIELQGSGYMQRSRVLPAQVARSPREGEASSVGVGTWL